MDEKGEEADKEEEEEKEEEERKTRSDRQSRIGLEGAKKERRGRGSEAN